jgi:hypothetical protein
MKSELPNFTVLFTGMSNVCVRAESLSMVRTTTVFMSSITTGFCGSGGRSGGTMGLTTGLPPSGAPGFRGVSGFKGWRAARCCCAVLSGGVNCAWLSPCGARTSAAARTAARTDRGF